MKNKRFKMLFAVGVILSIFFFYCLWKYRRRKQIQFRE